MNNPTPQFVALGIGISIAAVVVAGLEARAADADPAAVSSAGATILGV